MFSPFFNEVRVLCFKLQKYHRREDFEFEPLINFSSDNGNVVPN